LQRDPRGPDVFGAVYAYPSRQFMPPVRPLSPVYATGLDTLSDATALIDAATRLSAADVWGRFMPQANPAVVEPLGEALASTAALTRQHLIRQMDFPLWLVEQYNLPGPYIDEGGALRIPVDVAPGQGGQPGRFSEGSSGVFAPPAADMWLVGIDSPLARLQAVTGLRERPVQSLYSYVPFAWEPARLTISDAWQVQRPRADVTVTPSAVFSWIPRPLSAPQAADVALRIVERALVLPELDALDRVNAALASALPLPPSLPPDDSGIWLRRWFVDDTLGIAETLGARWPDLSPPDVPAFGLFDN
jgi:hypothetical protein